MCRNVGSTLEEKQNTQTDLERWRCGGSQSDQSGLLLAGSVSGDWALSILLLNGLRHVADSFEERVLKIHLLGQILV